MNGNTNNDARSPEGKTNPEKSIDIDRKFKEDSKTFKYCMSHILSGSLMVRLCAFLTVMSMFIMGIITLPMILVGIGVVAGGIIRFYKDREYMPRYARVIISVLIGWTAISFAALLILAIMFFTNNFCFTYCSDEELIARDVLLAIMLFL